MCRGVFLGREQSISACSVKVKIVYGNRVVVRYQYDGVADWGNATIRGFLQYVDLVESDVLQSACKVTAVVSVLFEFKPVDGVVDVVAFAVKTE